MNLLDKALSILPLDGNKTLISSLLTNVLVYLHAPEWLISAAVAGVLAGLAHKGVKVVTR